MWFRWLAGLSVLMLIQLASLVTVPAQEGKDKKVAMLVGEVEEEFQWIGETRQRRVVVLDLGGGEKLELVRIKAGTFQMGSPQEHMQQADKNLIANESETPQHEVTISKDFYLGKYTITKGQFARFVAEKGYQTEAETDGKGGWGYKGVIDADKTLPFEKSTRFSWRSIGYDQGDSHPVVNVTWNDAKAFCEWAKKQTGKPITLPTEAQYEYSARGGTTTRFITGDDPESLEGYENVADQTAKEKFNRMSMFGFSDGYFFSSPVGRFKPNGFGLFDMTGNVFSWCSDKFDEKYYVKSPNLDPQGPANGERRVIRGSSWFGNQANCRVASRGGYDPANRSNNFGLRVVFSLD